MIYNLRLEDKNKQFYFVGFTIWPIKTDDVI